MARSWAPSTPLLSGCLGARSWHVRAETSLLLALGMEAVAALALLLSCRGLDQRRQRSTVSFNSGQLKSEGKQRLKLGDSQLNPVTSRYAIEPCVFGAYVQGQAALWHDFALNVCHGQNQSSNLAILRLQLGSSWSESCTFNLGRK